MERIWTSISQFDFCDYEKKTLQRKLPKHSKDSMWFS